MNLTELQIELRSIEEHISTLHSEIEKMKPQPEEEKKTDFEMITKLAERNKIVRESIFEAHVEVKKSIFSSLSYIPLLEDKDFNNRILYLCRLSKGCDFDASAEELYKLGLEYDMSDLYKLSEDIAEYKYTYLVEAFIMANLSGEASANMLSIISDLANELSMSKEEIRVLGMVAKSVLTNNMDYILNIPVPSKNIWNGKLEDYIPAEWITKQRKFCGRLLCKKNFQENSVSESIQNWSQAMYIINCFQGDLWEIKNQLQSGSIVKKGDIVCRYTKKSELKNGLFSSHVKNNKTKYEIIENTIKAPCDGMVYFVENKMDGEEKKYIDSIDIYVVSYFDDYKRFCKWHKIKDL